MEVKGDEVDSEHLIQVQYQYMSCFPILCFPNLTPLYRDEGNEQILKIQWKGQTLMVYASCFITISYLG